MKIEQHDVAAILISERINLMIENGGTGLLLVVLVLFLFLPMRIAFWVAAGIPIAFLATFGVMFGSGQSINMISLFGLIMALGIVVDDAIVIGEHAEYLRKKRNLHIQDAAILAAKRMGPPVLSGDADHGGGLSAAIHHQGHYRGDHLGDSGGCVCGAGCQPDRMFLYPACPSGALWSFWQQKENILARGFDLFRQKFDAGFDFVKDRVFGVLVRAAYQYRYVTFAFAVGLLMTAVGMMTSNRVGFVFFSAPEADRVFANVRMVAGSTRSQTDMMPVEMERALAETENSLTDGQGGLVKLSYSALGTNVSAGEDGTPSGGSNDLEGGDCY